MKNVINVLAIGAVLASLSVVAHANYQPYVDLGVGYTDPENMPAANTFNNLDGVISTGATSSTSQNFGGRVGVGVLWNIEGALSYGLETAAAFYGMEKYSNAADSVEMNYYGIELLGVAQWNLDKLRFIVKAGATDEQLHPTKSNIDNPELNNSQQVLPEVGAGIAYAFTPNVQVGVSYYHTFGNNVSFDSTGDAENLPSVNMGLLEITFLC